MSIETVILSDQVNEFLKPMFGKPCCKQRVSEPRGLRLGFGEKLYHQNQKLIDPYYGEWELGTYYCAWRVVKAGRVLCGSDDSVESASELNAALASIQFGAILKVEQLGGVDICVSFDTKIAVDFFATTSDETDECIEIIHSPSHTAVEFTVGSGWLIGASNAPWKR